LQINFQIEKIKPGLVIAPLLLVVLIENAFKFVSNFPDRENKICIRLSTKDNVLQSTFSNTKDSQESDVEKKTNGIGVANLKRRLELLYSGKFRYTVKNELHFYETILTIDLS
jgi:LytS/YehU family sensor histidine kinase